MRAELLNVAGHVVYRVGLAVYRAGEGLCGWSGDLHARSDAAGFWDNHDIDPVTKRVVRQPHYRR